MSPTGLRPRPPALPRAVGFGDELRALSSLAWPVIIGNLGSMGMGVVDTVMVGGFGGDALAAVALANTWGFAVVVVARNTAKGLDPIVAQAFGAGDRAVAGQALVHGLVLALVMAVPVALLHLVAAPGLALFGQPAALLPLAGRYAAVLGLGVLPMLLFIVLRQFLQGLGVVKAITVAVMLANVLNVALNMLLMHGAGGLAGLGPMGCAWSTVVCQFFMLAVLLWLTRGTLRAWWPARWRSVAVDLAGARRVLSLGLPVGLQVAIEAWGFLFVGIMVGWLGEDALAAHTIALNLATVSFMTPLGIGAAAATRIGNLVGAGQPWGRAALTAVGAGATVMLASALIFTLFPATLAGIYTRDRTVVALAITLIPIAGAFQLFDGVQVVSAGLLRGLADVRLPAMINVVAYWGFGMPLGYLLAFRADLGAPGVWMGLVAALATVSGLLMLRIRRLHARDRIQEPVRSWPRADAARRPPDR